MSTPPFANQRTRTLREIGELVHALVHSLGARAVLETRRQRVIKRRVWSRVSDTPWRIGVGVVSVLVPALLLAAIGASLPVTTPGIVLLVAVAGSTYLADWLGGATSLLFSALLLDLFFIGGRFSFDIPNERAESAGFAITVICGAALILLIQRIKFESQV
ncbi:MAG: DUF4118 domain-containing protein, partial [Thermomicrobiales bacterium]|nr:DUF4118 domain-containing protein [Thermomicrobiales bacterium]